MSHHFEGLRLPEEHLALRHDAPFEAVESGQEHRVAVLRALQQATQDLLVAKYTYRDNTDDPEFLEHFVTPLWEGLSASLTRQDMLRWLVDWAHQSVREQAFQQIERLQEDLNSVTGI